MNGVRRHDVVLEQLLKRPMTERREQEEAKSSWQALERTIRRSEKRDRASTDGATLLITTRWNVSIIDLVGKAYTLQSRGLDHPMS
jgi:hypothetical protein